MGACVYCGRLCEDPHEFPCDLCGFVDCRCPPCPDCGESLDADGRCTCRYCDTCEAKLKLEEEADDVCSACLQKEEEHGRA